jgi:hypothetical protein
VSSDWTLGPLLALVLTETTLMTVVEAALVVGDGHRAAILMCLSEADLCSHPSHFAPAARALLRLRGLQLLVQPQQHLSRA